MIHWKRVQCCFMDNWKSANARKMPSHFDVSFLLSFSLLNRKTSCWDMLSPCTYSLLVRCIPASFLGQRRYYSVCYDRVHLHLRCAPFKPMSY
ncbi:hypothetical protein PAHAL_2G118600 [Panicum hallii]|uniref:Uncharacterized protein n=1 Tax=Panicum hallii TaxID=206008 RepID=A0A2T8KNX1_9POAL|nr:hypothetical protein PAHAL_2G118600 [Panicum hallii]